MEKRGVRNDERFSIKMLHSGRLSKSAENLEYWTAGWLGKFPEIILNGGLISDLMQ
jgi:hypothetical protein